MSRDGELQRLLDRQQFCCLEDRLGLLKEDFGSSESSAALALVDAAARLCGGCRDLSHHDAGREKDPDRAHRDLLHGQLRVLLTALDALVASESNHGKEANSARHSARRVEPSTPSVEAEAGNGVFSSLAHNLRRVSGGLGSLWTANASPPDSKPRPALQSGDAGPSLRIANGASSIPSPRSSKEPAGGRHSMQIYMLGPFRACVDGTFIWKWPRGKSRKVFQYLVSQRNRSVVKERLMDVFWPESDGDAARNSLYVAIYGIRKVLRQVDPDFDFILYRESAYGINPAVDLWIDRDYFLEQYKLFERHRNDRNERARTVARQAVLVFEDGGIDGGLQEEWAFSLNQSIKDKYGIMVRHLIDHSLRNRRYDEAIDLCNRAILVDPYDEEVHRHLMLCHYREGRIHLALRQYGRCVDALNKDLKIAPAARTTELFRQIRQRTLAGTDRSPQE